MFDYFRWVSDINLFRLGWYAVLSKSDENAKQIRNNGGLDKKMYDYNSKWGQYICCYMLYICISVEIIACRLVGAKPLSEPMLEH